MAVAETLVRQRVKTIFDTVFAAEGFVAEHRRLLRASGRDGSAVAGVSPEDSREDPRIVGSLVVNVLLQLHLGFNDSPDEDYAVDPTIIEGYASRLRTAFKTQSSGSAGDFWYLRLKEIRYPEDPTGNKSRFDAYIEGRANNEAAGG